MYQTSYDNTSLTHDAGSLHNTSMQSMHSLDSQQHDDTTTTGYIYVYFMYICMYVWHAHMRVCVEHWLWLCKQKSIDM